jgi:hypothetical protein
VRSFSCAVVATWLLFAACHSSPGQDVAAEDQPQDQFFSGTVTALTETSVTVTRTVLGKDSTVRSFIINAETHFEGKPKVKSKVTVRFLTGENGDRAVRIIVRGATPPPKK